MPDSRSSAQGSEPAIPSGDKIAFIGGGNMATAIIAGLVREGLRPEQIVVVEPLSDARGKLERNLGVTAIEAPGPVLESARLVVWAVKPQSFKEAALQTRFFTRSALHLSVAAGIPTQSMVHWLGTERIVRCMPNTPALIGKGMTALFARPGVDAEDQQRVARVIGTTGDHLWVEQESQLDAVTALSGSGPAYVFYFIEAMTLAGVEMGLSREQASRLAIGTFVGASELARSSSEPPEILRQRVTSKGGTTYAALSAMEEDRVMSLFVRAMHAARQRATELGEEFGS